MQGLKVLVIGMGVAIVVMITVIVTTMANRVALAPDSLPSFEPQAVEIPTGGRVVGTSVGDGRVVVHVEFPDRPPQLLLIDAVNGRHLGTIDLMTSP